MSEFSIGIIADWLRLPFEESLKTCADMGADGVQLYAVSGEMAPENLTPAQIAEKRRCCPVTVWRFPPCAATSGVMGSPARMRTRAKSKSPSGSSTWRWNSGAMW